MVTDDTVRQDKLNFLPTSTYVFLGASAPNPLLKIAKLPIAFVCFFCFFFWRKSLDELPFAFAPSVFFRRESLDELPTAFPPSVFFF